MFGPDFERAARIGIGTAFVLCCMLCLGVGVILGYVFAR